MPVGKLIGLVLITLLAAGGITVYSVPGMSKPLKGWLAPSTTDILTHTVHRTDFTQTVVDRGQLESSKNLDVYCEVEGGTTIIAIKPEGTRVKKGEIVCELDSASLKDTLVNQYITTKSASANYANATLTREVAEIAVQEYEEGIFVQDLATVDGEIKLAESDLSRSLDRVEWARRMYEKGYVSQANKVTEELALQKANFTKEQAQTKRNVLVKYTKGKTIKELKSEVEKARSDELAKKATWELEVSKEKKLERQIKACTLLAPNDGLVVYANDPSRGFMSNAPQVEEGATVRERQKIFALPDIAKMQVNTKVHESQIREITPGMKAKIRVEALADVVLHGTVVDVSPLPDQTSFFSSDIKVYTTHVRIDDPVAALRPGMGAQVEILVDHRDDVLTIPVLAILQYGGKDHVAKKDGDRFDRIEVELGPSNEKEAQVMKGLSEGDVVALNPIGLMSDEEKREVFGSNSRSGDSGKTWGMPGAPEGAPGPDGKAAMGPGGATKKGGDPSAKGAAKARTKGGARGGAFSEKMKSLSPEERSQLRTASPEERLQLLKKAGLTDAEIEQMSQMRRGGGGGPGGPGGGGGFGGGGGRPGGQQE